MGEASTASEFAGRDGVRICEWIFKQDGEGLEIGGRKCLAALRGEGHYKWLKADCIVVVAAASEEDDGC